MMDLNQLIAQAGQVNSEAGQLRRVRGGVLLEN